MMFKPKDDSILFSRKGMEEQLVEAGSICALCHTRPEQFVYNVYRQTCWCPRCGMPPVPQPEFMIQPEPEQPEQEQTNA